MNRISRTVVRAALVVAVCFLAKPAGADPVGLQWPQPAGAGTDVFITYSYSNLLDGSFTMLGPAELRAATEEALGLWAQVAPIHFIERPDSGPPPSDASYDGRGHPQIRLGSHPMADIAHAFFPGDDGLAGDVHFDASLPWILGAGRWNFLEAITHELGHALGLDHESDAPAVMNPFYPQQRFTALGTAFLMAPDIANLQAIYGAGRGSVQSSQSSPIVPEPGTVILVGTGVAALIRGRRRRRPSHGEQK